MPKRAAQHLMNEERRRLDTINVIRNDEFNKSAILDLESFLIKYMSSDEKYVLQNGNGGISNHNYYDKERYESQFENIWEMLRGKKLTKHTLAQIENSDLFKYSPYKALSTDQYRVMFSILVGLCEHIRNGSKSATIVNGSPGTGKTVLAVYLLKRLADCNAGEPIIAEDEDIPEDSFPLNTYITETLKGLTVGLVVPMQALRKTITGVASKIRNIDSSMILKPTEVANKHFDILIVDEAHRLHRRKALSQYPIHDNINRKLGLGVDGTELDWIRECSDHQIFFYDAKQSVRPCDVSPNDFDKFIHDHQTSMYTLTTQFRCKAGEEYIKYIGSILSGTASEKKHFEGYELKLFGDPNQMISQIKEREKEYGLSRTVAGYAWPWVSKKDKEKPDFVFGDQGYKWNTKLVDWVNSPTAIDEIGCIHTIQGYDLNHVGVIIGRDIRYNAELGIIEIDKSNYHDHIGLTVDGDMDLLRRQILNVYYTLLTRGICGTYIYICDEPLRKYFEKCVDYYEG
jgi:DUF2075 family protein/DNA replication protein DnaC